MTGCSFVVEPWLNERRPCGRYAQESLGALTFCWQHKQRLLEMIASEIRWGQPDPECRETALQRIAREQLHARSQDEREQARLEQERERRERSVVYFVERDGFVKIGYTANIKKRVSDIGKGSSLIEGMTVGPVRLLATLPGDEDNERHFHRKFAEYRVGGEWFLLVDELWNFVVRLKGYTGEPRNGAQLVGVS